MYKCPVCNQVFPRKQDHYDEKRNPCDSVAVARAKRELKKLQRGDKG